MSILSWITHPKSSTKAERKRVSRDRAIVAKVAPDIARERANGNLPKPVGTCRGYTKEEIKKHDAIKKSKGW